MSIRTVLFLAVAGISVIAVMVGTRSYLTSLQTQQTKVAPVQKQEPSVQILVAKRDLPVGRILQLDDMQAQPWPKDALTKRYIADVSRQQSLVGQVVRSEMIAGEPIAQNALVAQGERGFMAAILTPGMRAATVNLTPVAGVGGFIFPGDRVDVILTHSGLVLENGTETTASETVMQNVRVLAVDQVTEQADGGPKIRRTATLEVTPKMAEKVAMLDNLGTLSLSLRSLARDDQNYSDKPYDLSNSATLAHEVSRYITKPDEKKKKGPTVLVRRGSVAQETEDTGSVATTAQTAANTASQGQTGANR